MPHAPSVLNLESPRSLRPLRVVLMDEHAVVREGLRALLESEPGVVVTGEASCAIEVFEAVRRQAPDVILMELRLQGPEGLDLVRDLKRRCPEASILLLTVHDSGPLIQAALEAGASGYLLKESPAALVRQALRTVQQGGTVLHPRALRALLAGLPRTAGPGNGHCTPESRPALTERELEILALVAQGNSNRNIADRIHLSESTVKKYVQSVLGKMGAADRTEAAVVALRLGLFR